MADPFESAWLKWAWAVVDANVLAANVNELASQGHVEVPLAIRSDYYPKRHCIVLTLHEVPDLFPPHWGLLLGSVVYNSRCALDHVAWALYKRGRTPNLSDRKERRVYFPIYDDRIKFNKSLESKLPGVRRADIAKVRRFQPYLAPKRRRHEHVLWAINELATLDKHRTIQPVHPVPDKTAYDIGTEFDCIYRRMSARSPRGVLKPGAELTRLYVKRTGPEPRIDVQPHFAIDPAVKVRLPLQEFLKKTMTGVGIVLSQFAEQPASVENILSSVPVRPVLPP